MPLSKRITLGTPGFIKSIVGLYLVLAVVLGMSLMVQASAETQETLKVEATQ